MALTPCEALCETVACAYNSPAACEVVGTDFASKMIDGGNYPWDTLAVETTDGYELNMVNVFDPLFALPTKGPLLLIHDEGMGANEWLNSSDAGSSLLVNQLVDAGYDVYLANLRGSLASRTHTTLDSDSAEYWDFDTDAFAYLDLPAMIEAIQAFRGGFLPDKKVMMWGKGSGAAAAIKMIADASITVNSDIQNVLAQEPCLLPNVEPLTQLVADGEDDLIERWAFLRDVLINMDINSVYGPDWTNQVERICNIYELFEAGSDQCDALNALTVDADGLNEIGVNQLDNLIQIASGEVSPVYDLSALAAPITPIYVAGDEQCDADAAKAILDPVTSFSINWPERANNAGNNDAAWVASVQLFIGEGEVIVPAMVPVVVP